MSYRKELLKCRSHSMKLFKKFKLANDNETSKFYKSVAISATYIYNRDKTNSLLSFEKVKIASFQCLDHYEDAVERGMPEELYIKGLNSLKQNIDFLEFFKKLYSNYWIETNEEKKRKEIEENIRIYKENLLKVSCQYCNKCLKSSSLKNHYNSIKCKKARWNLGLPPPS